jgi:long-chain fatty acid transport protein
MYSKAAMDGFDRPAWLPTARHLLIAALAFGAHQAGATNGYFLEGYGTDEKAQAGVGIALPLDPLTLATNPAGLTAIADAVTVGAEIFRPRRDATLVQGGEAANFDGNGTRLFYLPEIGYGRHLGERLAWGVALYGNGGLDTDYGSNPFARFGARGRAGVDLEQAFLSPGLALKIGDANSVGLAVNIAYQRFESKGIGIFSNFSGQPAEVSNRGHDDSTGIGARLGWLGRLNDYVTFGATWQSKIHMGRFSNYAGLFAGNGAFDIPESYGLGIAVRPTTALTIGLDWQRIVYGGVPAVSDSIDSLFAGVALGSAAGPGFGWRSISVVKLGASYAVDERLTVRAGVSESQQPVPASQTFFNILAPGVIRTHLTVGARWNLAERNAISVAYLHAFEKTVYGSGSIPTAFGGGEANISLQEDSLAVSFSHGFQ